MVLPSGESYTITHGPYRATVVEVGGGIRTLHADGTALVQGYAADAMCDSARGQLLVPWPNRIEDARYTFDEVPRQLAVTEVSSGCAIHGLTRWANWRCVDHQADLVTLAHRLHPQPGWPGTLDLEVAYRLSDSGLEVTVSAHNVGKAAVPFGAGAHPYLVADDGPIDDWTLTLPAETVATTDARGLPIARRPVNGTTYDFRDARQIGDVVLDNPFTDLTRDAHGNAQMHLTSPSGHGVTLWADANHKWLQVFTGDHLTDPSRRRSAVAVEPMTCPPNAFRTGEDLIILEPDDHTTIRWGIQAIGGQAVSRSEGR